MLETMADSEPTQALDRALGRSQISWSLSKRITGLVVLRRAIDPPARVERYILVSFSALLRRSKVHWAT
jgi:hypothetical protein